MLLQGRCWASGKCPDTALGVGKLSLRCEKAVAGIPWLLSPQWSLEDPTEKLGTKCVLGGVHRPETGPGAPKLQDIQALLSHKELRAELGVWAGDSN